MKKTSLLYDLENTARKKVEFSVRKLPEVKIGQIWWYYVGLNIGQEISKSKPYLRPCVITKVITKTSLIKILPLTSKSHKKWSNYYLALQSYKKHKLKKSWILLHQAQIIDKKRLIKIHSSKILSSSFIIQLQELSI